MKTKINLKDLKSIKNYFNDNASEASSQIIELIKRLEEAEVEVDEKTLYEEIKALFEKEVPEAVEEVIETEVEEQVANAIAKFRQGLEVKNTVDKKELKNNIAKAVMNTRNREDAMKAVKEVANGITFTSGDWTNPVVDYTISNKWFEEDDLFNALNKTQITKFFYTTQDWDDTYAKASEWVKTSTDPKAIQELTVSPKAITTSYIYKRQQVAQEDLDDINDSGNLGEFLDWTTWELRRHVIDMIVAGVLGEKNLTNIEGIKTSGTSTAFVIDYGKTGLNASDTTSYMTIDNIRGLADEVIAKGEKWLVINPKDFTKVAKHIYASGGTSMYHTEAELAEMVGVDKIYKTTLISEGRVICFIPSEYWVKIKNTLNLAYPQYEMNAQNLQYEINLGGKIHGLLSAAVLYNNYE
jgi:hypothetical protein